MNRFNFMNRKFIILCLTFLCASFMVKAETYRFDIGQFEKIKVNGNFRVIYKNLPDSSGYAYYSAPAGHHNIFNITVKNDGTLVTELMSDRWGQEDLPVLHLYSDFLSSLESQSNQTINIKSLAPCASFTVKQIGNGTITVDGLKCNKVDASINTGNGTIILSGQCINANYQMIGAGMISADQLVAENVKCRILGTGNIGCWAVDNLNVSGIGTTKIYYKGSPNIKKTGGGKLIELPEEDQRHKGVAVPSFDEDYYKTEVSEDD